MGISFHKATRAGMMKRVIVSFLPSFFLPMFLFMVVVEVFLRTVVMAHVNLHMPFMTRFFGMCFAILP